MRQPTRSSTTQPRAWRPKGFQRFPVLPQHQNGPEESVMERIQQVRSSVDALRVALESPEQAEMDACIPRLEEAVACLQAAERALVARAGENAAAWGRPEMGLELRSLSQELEVARRLVIYGAAFCESWGRMLGVAAGGYVASGEAAPLEGPVSISIKG